MIAGAQYIDCKNMDLLKGMESQTITGLFKKVDDAIKRNVAIVAYNCIWGTGKKVTPINCFAIKMSDDLIIVTSSTLQIWITDEDAVTIHNMAPAE